MDTVVIIPARGGSKRVPGKNMALLAGKPLLQYTLKQVKDAGTVGHCYVSSEDAEIRSFAESMGVKTIDRPVELADDASSTEDVLIHALDILAKEGREPEWIMTLEPTSPFRSSQTIQQFLNEAASLPDEFDCVMSTIERVNYFWRRHDDGSVEPLFADAPRRQQERKEQGFVLYEEGGGIYVSRVSALRERYAAGLSAPILGKKAKGIPIDSREGFDINTSLDFITAETIAQSLSPEA